MLARVDYRGLLARPFVAAAILLAAIWLLGLLVNASITLRALAPGPSVDWDTYVEASRRVGTDQLYAWPDGYGPCPICEYRYSPVFAWLIGIIAPIGQIGWRALHVAVLPLMGPWLAFVTLLAWPFWLDFQDGNLLTFTLAFGVLALRGNRWGGAAYFALAIMTPRPFLLPLALWLLWRQPTWRVPVAIGFVAHGIAVLFSGYATDWIADLLAGSPDFGTFYDYGPGEYIGTWWVVIGIPLAAILTWRGRVGLASLAIQPYWLGYYLLMSLLELAPRPVGGRADAAWEVGPTNLSSGSILSRGPDPPPQT